MQNIVGGKVWIQFLKGSVVQNRAEPVIGSNGQMYPAIGAYIQAFGPDLAGGAAAAFLHSTNCGCTQPGAAVPASRRTFSWKLRSCWLTGNSFSMAFIPNTL